MLCELDTYFDAEQLEGSVVSIRVGALDQAIQDRPESVKFCTCFSELTLSGEALVIGEVLCSFAVCRDLGLAIHLLALRTELLLRCQWRSRPSVVSPE